jgi:hypothetical protein
MICSFTGRTRKLAPRRVNEASLAIAREVATMAFERKSFIFPWFGRPSFAAAMALFS